MLFSSHLSITMYHNLPPQIKGSIEKEQVLLANNLFVWSYFQQTIAKWFVITYTFGCWHCIIHSIVCFRCNFVCNFLSRKWQLVWQLVLDGWFWMVAGIGSHGYSGVNFGSRKKQSGLLPSHLICSKCFIVHSA